MNTNFNAKICYLFTYVGIKTINGVDDQVLELKMIGSVRGGRECPFHQKIYIGPDNLLHRLILDFTLDGESGSEVAKLKNIQIGQAMTPNEFVFIPPVGS